MGSSAYISVYIEDCIRKHHHFDVIGSDKTPMKRSLVCRECSGSGFTAMAAHGVEQGSFGPWRRPQIKDAADLPLEGAE